MIDIKRSIEFSSFTALQNKSVLEGFFKETQLIEYASHKTSHRTNST